MSNLNLELPFHAVISQELQNDNSISDSEKLYLAQITPFSRKYGYMWLTDEQLSELKGVSIRTIQRWNNNLENAGYIKRVSKNVPKKIDGKKLEWNRERKIYIFEVYDVINSRKLREENKNHPIHEKDDPEIDFSKNVCDSDISGGAYDSDISGGAYDSDISGVIKDNSSDISFKEEDFSSFSSEIKKEDSIKILDCLHLLDLSTFMKQKVMEIKSERNYSDEDIEIGVKRVLNWKNRDSDERAIFSVLKNKETWKDTQSEEEKVEERKMFLKSLHHLDSKDFFGYRVTIGNNYIEFAQNMFCKNFNIEEIDMINKIKDFMNKFKK